MYKSAFAYADINQIQPIALFGFAQRRREALREIESMRILVIEDEARMLELLRMGLHEHGFSVMTVCDAETGMEIMAAHQCDAVVLDIGLPSLDGYGLTKALRAGGQTTPVLMLTARDAEDDIIRGLDLGADDYLTKPFAFSELVARLHAITRHASPRSRFHYRSGRCQG